MIRRTLSGFIIWICLLALLVSTGCGKQESKPTPQAAGSGDSGPAEGPAPAFKITCSANTPDHWWQGGLFPDTYFAEEPDGCLLMIFVHHDRTEETQVPRQFYEQGYCQAWAGTGIQTVVIQVVDWERPPEGFWKNDDLPGTELLPVVADRNGEVAALYGVTSWPTMFLVSGGEIQQSFSGWDEETARAFHAAMEKLVEERSE